MLCLFLEYCTKFRKIQVVISSPNDVIPRNIMTLLITQEGIFYDKEDLASNKTYLFYLSFKLNKKPR